MHMERKKHTGRPKKIRRIRRKKIKPIFKSAYSAYDAQCCSKTNRRHLRANGFKILNVLSDLVFFNVTKLRKWFMPEIILHEMLRSGGKFYSQMRKALMVFSGFVITRLYQRRLSQRETVEEAQS